MKRIYNDFDQNTVMLLAQASYNAYPNSSDRPNQLEGYESICWFYGYDFRNKLAEEKMVAVYKKITPMIICLLLEELTLYVI